MSGWSWGQGLVNIGLRWWESKRHFPRIYSPTLEGVQWPVWPSPLLLCCSPSPSGKCSLTETQIRLLCYVYGLLEYSLLPCTITHTCVFNTHSQLIHSPRSRALDVFPIPYLNSISHSAFRLVRMPYEHSRGEGRMENDCREARICGWN